MKQGKSLQEMAQELQRQSESRKDYIADQDALVATVVDGRVALDGLNGAPVEILPFAHQQIADHLSIPKKYYDRMLAEKPALLADNVNEWLHDAPQEKRMVRTLDGKARAFLSSRFRPLDNFELAEAVIPKLINLGVEVQSAELTETRIRAYHQVRAAFRAVPGLRG